MMIKIMKKAIVLGLTALVLFTGIPAQSVKAMDNAPLHSSLEISGKAGDQKVTYELKLDKSSVTDGRVAVVYDPKVLTLTDSTTGIKFPDYDFNNNYSEDEGTGISYAFVNEAVKRVSGSLLKLTFTVNAGVDYQDTVVKTEVFGINNDGKEVVSNVVLEDSVSVGRPNPETPAKLKATQTLLGVALTWKSSANADGYTVYRSASKDGNYAAIGTTSIAAYYDTSVRSGNTYYYKVEAFQNRESGKVKSAKSEAVQILVKKFLGIFG